MKLELELWQVIVLGSMILGAFYGMAQLLLKQYSSTFEEKFKALGTQITAQDENLKTLFSASSDATDQKLRALGAQLTTQDASDRHLERQLSDLRAELPREYVRREDFVRVIASVDVQIANLRLTIERAMFHGSPK